MVEQVWEWANQNAGAVGLIISFCGGVAWVFGYLMRRFSHKDTRNAIGDIKSREILIARFERDGADTYFDRLRGILGFATRIYGDKPLSWRAYGTCLSIAFAYPLLSILLGWLFFNVWAPAGIEMFRDTEGFGDRLWRFAALIAGFSIATYIVRNAGYFSQIVVAIIWSTRNSTMAGRMVVVFLAFTFALVGAVFSAVVGVVATTSTFTATTVVIITGIAALVATLAGVASFSLAVIFSITGGFAVGSAFAFADVVTVTDLELSIFSFLLCAFLPVLNAGADMVSLWITRSFLQKTLDHRPNVCWIIGQMGIDLCLAGLCLAGLLVSMIMALTLWGWISPTTVPLDWQAYWAGIHAEWRTGFALYTMALTTLIPTILHVAAGLGAVWTQKSRSLRGLAMELASQPADIPFSEIEISEQRRAFDRAVIWGHTRAALFVFGFFVPLIWGGYALVV